MTQNPIKIAKHGVFLVFILGVVTLPPWQFPLWQRSPDRALASTETAIPEKFAQTPVSSPISFETLDRGNYAGISQPFARTIEDGESWELFWNELYGNQIPIPLVREIDFSQKAIVAVGLGERNSGGYGIEIESVAIEEGTLAIHYRETTNTCGVVTMAFTQPYHLAIVDRVDLPVRFFRNTEEIGCDR